MQAQTNILYQISILLDALVCVDMGDASNLNE